MRRNAVTVTEARLDGWTDVHWNDLVLIGIDPRGRPWSIGEAVIRIGGGWTGDEQRIQSAVLVGPSGDILRLWEFERYKWPNRITVWRRVCSAVVRLGGTLREGPWKV